MNSGWIAVHRTETAELLIEHCPDAFLLITQIAMRARRSDCPITSLKKGEAMIGDFKKAGIASERKYRTAKKKLLDSGLATFKTTSKGTIAKLADIRVYSVCREDRDEQNDEQATGTFTSFQQKTQLGDRQATSKATSKRHT